MIIAYCESCTVIPVTNGERYCAACTDDICQWLFAAYDQVGDIAEAQRKEEDILYGLQGR